MKSKVSSVLPGGSFASARLPLEAPALAVGDLVAGERGEQAGGGPPVAVGAVGEASPRRPHGRQAQLLEQQVELGRVHDEAVAEESALGQLSGVKQHVDLGGEPSFAATAHGPGASRPTGGRALRPPRASSSASRRGDRLLPRNGRVSQPARLSPLLPTPDPSDSAILSGNLPFLAPLVQ